MPTPQYILCGTQVVSVPNIGGRDHFLKAPFAVTADPTPEAVVVGGACRYRRAIDVLDPAPPKSEQPAAKAAVPPSAAPPRRGDRSPWLSWLGLSR